MGQRPGILPALATRREYFEYFDGYAVQSAEGLEERQLGDSLLKTYVLETVGNRTAVPALSQIFARAGARLDVVEEGRLYRVVDPAVGGVAGVLEVMDERYPVLYTAMRSEVSDRWAHRLVESSPWLDHLWLSAATFEKLWDYVKATVSPHRYTRLTFEHEATYEAVDSATMTSDEDEPDDRELVIDDERRSLVERRSSKFTMVDRIDVVKGSLPTLQETYRPLASITQLRMPGAGRGGHDFYFNGKVTNRSDSFADHREHVAFVLETYRRLTRRAEEQLWVSTEPLPAPLGGLTLKGTPVYVRFRSSLDPATFNRWIGSVSRRRGRFRLGGRVLRLGSTKAHLYGIDRHLWQPVQVEFTTDHVVALLPTGTCANTVHRLVTNIQRFIDPAVRAWIGDVEYDDLVRDAMPTVGGT
jgi:hypothetical protein